MAGAKKTTPEQRRAELIREIVENQKVAVDKKAEAQSYGPLRNLLVDPAHGAGIPQNTIVVDSPVPFGRERPDVQIWLTGVPVELRNENEHLFGIVEVKPAARVRDQGKALARSELSAYGYAQLRHFWLCDAEVVHRYDLDGSGTVPDPVIFEWSALNASSTFEDCFGPVMGERRTLAFALRSFAELEVPLGKAIDDDAKRKDFVDSLVTVARILSRTVGELVTSRLEVDLKTAVGAIAELEKVYGAATFDFARGDEYLIFENEPAVEDYDAHHQFNEAYTELLNDLEPYQYALRAEKENLVLYAQRSGLNAEKVSFLKTDKEAKSGREMFIQETATLLFSRLLMIRFSEDHGLLTRYLSNGGLKAFADYARHFKLPFQELVRTAYDNAWPLYRHLFERRTLDWLVDLRDETLGDALLHAMWILARWDFTTVRGDILSGLYDRHLEPRQRKVLGEVYTRPELARYLLESCGWTGAETVLDPACGSGTFLVEAFESVRRKRVEDGFSFDTDDAHALLRRLHGLDINEFSSTLAKIQLLWHVLSAIKTDPEKAMKEAISVLHIEGGHSSLNTWGISMETSLFGGEEGHANTEVQAAKRGTPRRLKSSERRFRDIATARSEYDIVVGNPPYVRVHRIQMSDEIRRDYEEVAIKQTDLSAFFVFRALRWWLKDGGRLGFFLPLAVTEAAYAERMRAEVERYRIVEIVDLELVGNAAFHGAHVVTVALVVEKTAPTTADKVRITTVTADCLDPVSNRIDMSKARVSEVLRGDIMLSRYIGTTPSTEEDEQDDEDEARAGKSAWLTKVTSDDVPILTELAKAPRLRSLVSVGFQNRTGKTTHRALAVPESANPNQWRRVPIIGQGVEIGGKPPNDTGGLPIVKARWVFPNSVEGQPYGHWKPGVGTVTQPRFYSWWGIVDNDRSFVTRKINLQPTFTRHPSGMFLQNTVYILNLDSDLPLDVYSLSRLPAWFLAKTGRMSVVQKFWSTWVPRNLLLMPVPSEVTPKFVAELHSLGNRLTDLDLELASGDAAFRSYADLSSSAVKPLKLRPDLIKSGAISRPDTIAWPDADEDWSMVVAKEVGSDIVFVDPLPLDPEHAAQTGTGDPCKIHVADAKLRRWLLYVSNDALNEEVLPSQSWMGSLPIPENIDSALAILDRLENKKAADELSATLDQLDAVVGGALGLNPEQIEAVARQMNSDPLLRYFRPHWRHKSKRNFA